jgi:hypothetical protein
LNGIGLAGKKLQQLVALIGKVDWNTVRFAQPSRDEVDGALERVLLGDAVVGPKRVEPGLFGGDHDKADQVFEAAAIFEERVAFHVKEDVARIGSRQPGKTLARKRRQYLEPVFSAVALRQLERGLALQPADRFRQQARDPRAFGPASRLAGAAEGTRVQLSLLPTITDPGYRRLRSAAPLSGRPHS